MIQGGCGLSNKCKAGKYPQGSANTYSYLDEFPHFESIVEVAGLKTLLALGAQGTGHTVLHTVTNKSL